MKRSVYHILALFLLGGMSLLSCSKGGGGNPNEPGDPHLENPADTIPPVVTISTPAENQEFSSGTTINMTGRITDNLGLYRGTVRLVNDANGAVLKEQAYEIHGLLSYNFNVPYVATVSAVSNYTVTVTFEDHGYNSVTSRVKIKVNP